jgi:Tol biopolymer transport system component
MPRPAPFVWTTLGLTGLAACGDSHPTAGGGTGDPGTPVQVSTTGGYQPAVSPRGDRIAYQVFGAVIVASADGARVDFVTTAGDQPDWSPDGSLILLRGDQEVVVISAVTGAVVKTITAPIDDDPAWAPDGRAIAFQTTTHGDGIYIVTYPAGAGAMVPCREPDGSTCAGEGPVWSPDGQWLAFEDALEIQKVRRSGGTSVVIVPAGHDVTEPAWSPDGRWIAFARDDGSGPHYNIWVVDALARGAVPRPVTSGPFLDSHPAWSPDSKTIYFDSDRSGTTEIWKVTRSP